MKINEIQDLIKFVAKSGVSEVSLEMKDFKIEIKTQFNKKKGETETTYIQTQTPVVSVPAEQTTEVAPIAEKKKDDSNQQTIKAPMIGTFYQAASPEEPPFVKVGDTITKGQVICIIEAMKLFNEIEAEISGKITKILVEDAAPVEYNQPLFIVDPN